jgi:hypothetical protein
LCLVVILAEIVRCTRRAAVSVVIHYEHRLAEILWTARLHHLWGKLETFSLRGVGI